MGGFPSGIYHSIVYDSDGKPLITKSIVKIVE